MKKYMIPSKVAIVIVTFNRKEYVLKNISHIKELPNSNFTIIIFDNGSTDGTKKAVLEIHPEIKYYKSEVNLGGAGGFKSGMKIAYDSGYEFIWCLDDDGAPHYDSLNNLLKEAKANPDCIYGTRIIPIGSNKEETFWDINGGYDYSLKNYSDISADRKKNIQIKKITHETASVALLGLFLHRNVIDIIGYPNENLFLANDDVEYCLRAWSNNILVKLVMNATVEHPPMMILKKKIFGIELVGIKMPPWKTYYYIRNIVCVNKIYFIPKVYFKMLLGTFTTLIVNILEDKRNIYNYIYNAFLAYLHGFINDFKLENKNGKN